MTAWARSVAAILLIAWMTPAVAATSLESLRREQGAIQQEIENAQAEFDRLAGGLVKSIIHARLELLKTNATLVQQRIQALEGRARIRVVVEGSKPDAERADALLKEMRALGRKIAEQEAESARYRGGLVKAMIESTIATSRMSQAMLHTEFLKAKYGIHWLPSLKQGATGKRKATPSAAREKTRPAQLAKRAEKDRSEKILIPKPSNKRF